MTLSFLHIETTTDCNLRCRHCAIRKPGYVCQYMACDVFDKLLPGIEKYRPWVNLSGHGETLLHADFLPMFLQCASSGARGIEFQTNAFALTPSLVARLLETEKWERLKASIDGATEGTYRWVRGTSLHRPLANLREFAKQRQNTRPGLTIEFCAMRRNIAEMPAVVEVAAELGADTFVVGDLMEYPGMEGQSLVNDWPAAEPHFRAAHEASKAAGIAFCPSEATARKMGLGVAHPKAQGGVCRVPWTTAFVNVFGKVRPCCKVEAAIGDLNVQAFDEVWNGEAARALREGMLAGNPPVECRTCTWVS